MINLVEYNDGESRLQGHVEVLPSEDKDGTYTVTSYIEDVKYSMPWLKVTPDKLQHITSLSEKGVLKQLKVIAEGYKTKSALEKLQDKGYFAQ